jgi:all-trans-retinol 13,14-reductase
MQLRRVRRDKRLHHYWDRNMKYDYIVIGSGISGLVSAIILSKNGYNVALIEKSQRIAPLLRGFHRKGIFFDTGFHHAGSFGKGEIGDIFFRYLGFSDNLKKIPCNPECFDIVRFSDTHFEFCFPSGYKRLRERLLDTFPHDKNAVDAYLDSIQKQCAALPYLNLDADFGTLEVLKSVHGPSLREFLDSLTVNELLKAMLSVHCLLNGVPPEEQALNNYAYIVGPYYESVHRFQGGGAAITGEFENSLARMGVDVFCGRAAIKMVLSPSGILQGVRLQDGTIIESKGCISTIHPLSMLKIVPESLFRPAYVARLEGLQETSSAFILYAESDSSPDILSGSSIYLSPAVEIDSFNIKNPLEDRPFNIASVCSQNGGPGKGGIIAICPASIDETVHWKDSISGDRPEGYRVFKEEISDRMLRHVESTCGELKGKIRPIDCSTPLTIRDYTSSPFGSMYGVKHKTEQYNPLPATRLPGFFLAGQSIIAPGLLGAIISGFVACGNILGHDHLRRELKKCS